MLFSSVVRLPAKSEAERRMSLRRHSTRRPSNPLTPRYLTHFNKKIIFKYKDSKIVKSPKENRHLRWATTEDLRNEVIQAFKQVTEPMKMPKERNRFIFKMIAPYCAAGQKSDEPIENPESPTPYDNVEVIVTTEDGRTFLVEIKTKEQGVHRNHTGLESKMMFCKTISVFYKNQERPAYKFDARRGSAPV